MAKQSLHSKEETARREARIRKAVEAMQNDPSGLSVNKAAKLYDVPRSTLHTRMKGQKSVIEKRPSGHKFSENEENALVDWLNHQDFCGTPANKDQIETMANALLKARGTRPAEKVGKHWVYNFMKRRHDLTYNLRKSKDFNRANSEDPRVWADWFDSVAKVLERYSITTEDIFTFDATGYMMGTVEKSDDMVRSAFCNEMPRLLSGKHKWVSVIECANASGWTLPSYITFKPRTKGSKCNAAAENDWYVEGNARKWTNDEISACWLEKLFIPFTKDRTKGEYRLFILDMHGSHLPPKFDLICRENKIILIFMPAHSSHCVQPFDVGCFERLKQAYSGIVEESAARHDKKITKSWFLENYPQARAKALKEETIRDTFAATGLVPFDPDRVISEIKAKLHSDTSPVAGENSPDKQIASNFEELEVHLHEVKDLFDIALGQLSGAEKQRLNQYFKGCEYVIPRMALAERNMNMEQAKKKRRKQNECET